MQLTKLVVCGIINLDLCEAHYWWRCQNSHCWWRCQNSHYWWGCQNSKIKMSKLPILVDNSKVVKTLIIGADFKAPNIDVFLWYDHKWFFLINSDLGTRWYWLIWTYLFKLEIFSKLVCYKLVFVINNNMYLLKNS